MSGFCGWFNGGRASRASPEVIAEMAAPLNRFDGSTLHSASTDFGAVAAAGGNASIFQDDERLVVVWGQARFTDVDLAAVARRHGVARAVAQGYARMGTGVLTTLSGACALPVLGARGGGGLLPAARRGPRPPCSGHL